jgi:hypothetical protein
MGRKRPPNPNTKYGRKRMRQETAEWKANLSPAEQRQVDFNGCIFYILVVLAIMAIIYFFSGSDGVVKWITH